MTKAACASTTSSAASIVSTMTGASATQHGRFDEPQGGAGAVGEEDAVNNWDDADEPWESWYDVGQICTNGHVVNWASKRWPQHNQARCSLCGAETTTVCVFCKHEIRGEYHVYNLSRLDGWTEPVPAYCRGCGAPHQWTKARLDAALELATEVISFTPEERAELAKKPSRSRRRHA
jgi:hypothetical protein